MTDKEINFIANQQSTIFFSHEYKIVSLYQRSIKLLKKSAMEEKNSIDKRRIMLAKIH